MTLEQKKKQLELSRVRLAREEMELKIQERQEEITKLEGYIAIQKAKEAELEAEIAQQ